MFVISYYKNRKLSVSTRSTLLAVIITLFTLPVMSQVITHLEKAAYEERLVTAFTQLYAETDDQQKIVKSEALQEYFGTLLAGTDFFQYPFDSVKWAGKITSPDKKLRIITWNVPLSDGTHRYYGFIQYKGKKKDKPVRLFTLKDSNQDIKDPEGAVFTPENWPGALYYDIRVMKHNSQVFYVLLGFDFNDRYSNKKIIDVLFIDGNMNARFGEPVFESPEGKMKNRVIFEYSSQAVMTLRWDARLKMIVFDHLAPIEPNLEGLYKFYGPSVSYDGYKFQRGIWKYYFDVAVRNE